MIRRLHDLFMREIFTPAVSIILLIQILLWTLNFAMGWGWFSFEGLEARSSFDDSHHSLYVVLERRNSTMTSTSRRSCLLIALHNLVLLNLLGITIALALQLAMKMAG